MIRDKIDCESLRDCFRDSFTAQGEKKAISFLREGMLETEISYKKLNQDSNRMANTFLDRGVIKGDRVILYLQKSLAFIIAHLAIQKIGAIGVPLNPGFKQSEMEYLLGDTQAKLVLLGPEQESIIKEIDSRLQTIVIHTERSYQECDFFSSTSDRNQTRGSRPYHLHLRYHGNTQRSYPYTGKSCS
jgi:acyl-coenzyme A synthetase/AMP-(fatty) acid ligase